MTLLTHPADETPFAAADGQRLREPLAILLSGTDILRHYGDRLPSEECASQREQMLEAAAMLSSMLAEEGMG